MPSDPLDSGNDEYLKEAWSEGNFQVEQVLYQRPGDPVAAGQTIRYAEPVGLFVEDGQTIKTLVNKCFELKQNSRYLLVLDRHGDGVYWLVNLNNGRFNTDGTDLDDEQLGGILPDGTKTNKQKLREELTAAYGVTFAVPTTVAPSISSLSPSSALPGGAAFTLTVNGADFKNGAVIRFGNTEKTTTFLSATKLTAPILASEIATAGSVPVVVKNPDNRVSTARAFPVQNVTLHPVDIEWTNPNDNVTTQIAIRVGNLQPDGAIVEVEKQNASGNWVLAAQGSAIDYCPSNWGGARKIQVIIKGTPVSVLPRGTNIRARVVLGQQATAYSNTFVVRTATYQDPIEDCGGDSLY